MEKTIFNSNQLSRLVKFIPSAPRSVYLEYQKLENYNRKVCDSHTKVLMDSFSMYGTASAKIDIVKTKAITGKTEYYIADGQHSIMAASRLRLPLNVFIIEFDDDTILSIVKYIALLNNKTKNWSSNNYIKSFYDIPEYKTFAEIIKSTGLLVNDLLHIFLGGTEKQHKVFKSGTMKFPNVDDSMLMLEATLLVKNYIPNKTFARRSLYKIFRLANDYKKMADAIVKTANHLKMAQSKFSENEQDFYNHLTEIYRAEFKIK